MCSLYIKRQSCTIYLKSVRTATFYSPFFIQIPIRLNRKTRPTALDPRTDPEQHNRADGAGRQGSDVTAFPASDVRLTAQHACRDVKEAPTSEAACLQRRLANRMRPSQFVSANPAEPPVCACRRGFRTVNIILRCNYVFSGELGHLHRVMPSGRV